jgi:transposase InsO family protein
MQSLGIEGQSRDSATTLELIKSGKPQQNGRHEHLHRTLKRKATGWPAANCRTQQLTFNRFPQDFTCDRPHEAIGLHTPTSLYQLSPQL